MKRLTSTFILVVLLVSATLILVKISIGTVAATTTAVPLVKPRASSFGGGNRVGNAGATVQALVSGDLDNDGNPDLVSADGKIIGWQNDGSPFSGLWNNHAVGSPGVAIYALALGDLDNDGDLDLASGSEWTAGREVQVWDNDGTPFDALWSPNDVGNADAVLVLAAGDLDNDGHLDLVSGDDGAAVFAWQNDGTPFSGAWLNLYLGSASTDVTALALGDLDNDGDLDIVAGNAADRVRAWENDGTPFNDAWSARDVFTTTDGVLSLALADADGDGDLDILIGSEAGEAYEVTTLQNDGTPFNDAWTQHAVGVQEASIYAVAAADLDVDGDPDLATAAQTHASNAEVQTWDNNGSPFAGAWSGTGVAQTGADVHALATADLDRDGDPDLIAATHVISAWPNTRALGVWSQWTEGVQPASSDGAVSVDLADLDYDGKLDLAAGTSGSGLHVWRGDGGYTWTQILAGSLPPTGTWSAVAWGQINNADEVDLAASSTDAGVRAWIVTQDGAVWDDASSGLPTSGNYRDLALGHVNHDGLLDLVIGGIGLGVRVWQGNGGVGSPQWTYKTTISDTLDFCDLSLGHVNHDGNLDIVAANCGGRGVSVWLGDPDFGFDATTSPTTTGSYLAVALGDVDNDGDADVAAAPSTGGVEVWLNQGGAGWTFSTVISPTLTAVSLDLSDFDNDGYLDILGGMQTAGVRVWKGDGGTSWTDASTNLATANGYYEVTFARVDADAALDVVGPQWGGSGGVRVWTAVEPPPGGWMNLQPETNPPYVWARGQQLTCTVQVVDVGSGLDVSSAQYRFSRNGGFSWVGGWLTATVSGADGSTAPQTITATAVPFNQDAETRNAVQFRIADLAGLTGTSPVYYVAVDTTPPANPTDLDSPDHTQGAWSDDQSVRITWTDEGSDNLSGVWGYSWLFNRVADERPDETVEQGAGPGNLIDLWGIPDGDWYFHFMTRDRAGNWADPVHLGPYRIDTADPLTPTLNWSDPAAGGWVDDIIRVGWNISDTGDLAGYSYVWHQNPSYYVDTITETTLRVATNSALDDGAWYLHVRAVDYAGNGGPSAHFGPFGLDQTPPSGCWLNVPRYSNSETCLVEWTALDATSGVASYDVQVRDDTYASPTWENWLVGTIATSATYTEASLGVYSFRVRARDQAGNESIYGCEDQTIVEDLDADGLEITQGIQNLDNDVPLIAGKTTYVRFYVRSVWNDVSNVDARLHGTRGGDPLPGSPLRPTGGRVTVRAGAVERSNLDDAFYFRLPPEWRSGTVELRAVMDPGDGIPEDEFHDNESTETVTFESSGDFCIVFVPVHLHPSTYYVGDAGFWDMVELTKWMYPVRDAGIDTYSVGTMYPDAHPYWHYGIPDDFDRILGDLAGVDFWTSDPCDDTHYYGMVHPDSYPGSGATGMGERYNTVVGDDAAGVMAISLGSAWPQPTGGRTMAHELGHNFRRKHVECTGSESDGGEVDATYPYPDRPPCRIGPNDPSAYYGFWPQPGGPIEIITPTQAADLMSYGLRRWPSDWTYRALLGELRDLVRMQTQNNLLALSPAWAQADEYLFAAGIINPAGQTAELRAFYHTSEPDPGFVAHSFQQELATATSDDTYSLVLEDAQGQVLYTHTFSATALTDVGPSPGTATFAEVFPYDAQTARIVLKQGATELASRSVSARAPTVTLLSPNGGETIGDQWTLSWSGSDPDGDDVRYSVQYSPDNGATWQSLAVDWMSTSLDVETRDLAILPGGEQALVRVTASDGVNTAQDQSDAVFSLARKTPQAHIIEPKTGAQYAHDSTIVLRGTAIDAEDGPLGETSTLTWTSNLSGTLGGGGELWVSGLTTGTHRITLAVADSDGDTGTDEVVIFVGLSPQKIYLPVVLKH